MPRLAVVRDSAATGKPIPWVQIHKLPDYVYFNHSVHVNRGVSCVECHGQINHMDEVYHAKPLSMSFCLDCHRDPAMHLRPLDKITDLDWKATGRPRLAPTSAHWARNCPRLEGPIAAKLFDLSSMKTIPPPCPEPENRAEVLAQSGRNWPTRRNFANGWSANFPPGASELTDPVSRRNFVKIMSASFLLAGLGRDRLPPAGGEYLSVCQNAGELRPRRSAIFCHRHADAPRRPFRWSSNPTKAGPTKIEGNPDHPGQQRRHRHLAQASVLSLYDPDRAMRCRVKRRRRKPPGRRWMLLAALSKTLGDGSGLAFLARTKQFAFARPLAAGHRARNFPTRAGMSTSRLIWTWRARRRRWLTAAPVEPYYKLDEAQVILSLDCDFIGSEENACGNIRALCQGPAPGGQGRAR